MEYDVIIAGASFAGLAVASQLRGLRVLLLDPRPIGQGQTSACGTLYAVLSYWGLTDSLLQTHRRLVLHTPTRSHVFQSPYLWCTFDYHTFCQGLYQRTGATFLQSRVTGTAGGYVRTTAGSFRARVALVDATGWRAALSCQAHSLRANFGIEAEVPRPPQPDPEALHFWYDPRRLSRGVGWLFPRGICAGLGVARYGRAGPLATHLKRLAANVGVEAVDRPHGGYFPYALRQPTVGNVFVVGDAAGMCLGLTGEGIRPALYFGEACGRILRQIAEEHITLAAGLRQYRAFVDRHRRFYRAFTWAQEILSQMPARWIDMLATTLRRPEVSRWLFRRYWLLTAAWGRPGSEAGTRQVEADQKQATAKRPS